MEPTHPPLRHIVPHWQAALDAKFEAAANLQMFMDVTSRQEVFDEALDLEDATALQRMLRIATARQSLKDMGFGTDLRVLPAAQAYSFSEETTHAILTASLTLPHDAPLSAVEAPNAGAGWFWFNDPLPFAASAKASDKTHALLWSWVQSAPGLHVPSVKVGDLIDPQAVKPALMFSAYVRNDKAITPGRILPEGQVLPSTRWFWPIDLTFHDMLAYNSASWKATYGPGTPLEHDPMIATLEETLKVIAGLSLFFVMACVWFRQTVPGEPKKKLNPVLTTEPGHIERHARKRYQKTFKLEGPPSVRVVALRKSARTEAPEHVPAEGRRTYHCRWIVQGHPRMQACGPGRKDRKLIWIEAHPAGPDDKPLRTKTTVFSVIR
jgi:hypothetical protein